MAQQTARNLNASVLESNRLALGSWGFRILSTTGSSQSFIPPKGFNFSGLMVDVDADFEATSTQSNSDNLPRGYRSAGRVIFGMFDSVTVYGGSIIAYLVPSSVEGS